MCPHSHRRPTARKFESHRDPLGPQTACLPAKTSGGIEGVALGVSGPADAEQFHVDIFPEPPDVGSFE
jgi:hypothetical protein